MTDPRQDEFRRRVAALGFDDVRFAAVAEPLRDPLRPWLAAGLHADMHWLERSADKRLDPQLVLPGARSIVMLGVSYWRPALAANAPAASGPPIWARYARHEDYHDTITPALAAAGRVLEEIFGAAPTDHRYYVDTGPVLERRWAARAGLGFTGKNAMLISRRHGNWLFLAALLTRVELTPDAPVRRTAPAAAAAAPRAPEPVPTSAPGPAPEDAPAPPPSAGAARPADVGALCGKCTRCLDACPTRAFAAPGLVDARRCISYQTIENKGVIPRDLRTGIGERIYGCDVCLEVCPWNRFAQAGRQVLLVARDEIAALSLDDLLALTPERFAAVFRRTPIKRVKLAGLLRNACIVAGNRRDPRHLPALVALASGHSSPLVRAHAVWAVQEFGASAQLAAARAAETDPLVLAEYAAG